MLLTSRGVAFGLGGFASCNGNCDYGEGGVVASFDGCCSSTIVAVW